MIGDLILVEGYVSVYCVDRKNDLIKEGAFSETLSQIKPRMYWMHNYAHEIGEWIAAYEDSTGLYGIGIINMHDKSVSKFQKYVCDYVLNHDKVSFSIGFNVGRNFKMGYNGVREISKVDLKEISLTPYGANPKAMVLKKQVVTKDALPKLLYKAHGIDYESKQNDAKELQRK